MTLTRSPSPSTESERDDRRSTESRTVILDGNEVEYREGETVLQTARRAGIEIPTLCHDDRIEPAGACRMCLVEVEGSRLMQPACHFKAAPGMVVRTTTPKVERNRRFILSLHMADTVDDRAAAEDVNPNRLFEHAERYGTAGTWTPVVSPRQGRPEDVNRFIAYRPEHCILCALCVRYCDEVEAVSAITLAHRGGKTTIATADAKSLTDTTCEMCGGCIDVCPTGAMVEKPALAYGKPQHELVQVRTTCNFCGVGCQLDLNVDREAGRVVKATSPPPGTTVNDGNLCVKGRFANDFVHHPDRLTVPLVRGEDGELREASWDEALNRAAAGLQRVAAEHGPDALAFISSSRCTGEENYLVQKMARAAFGTHNVHQCAAT
jgi:predicted molibdopterin-dependent oxidoreductase YjgC